MDQAAEKPLPGCGNGAASEGLEDGFGDGEGRRDGDEAVAPYFGPAGFHFAADGARDTPG